LGPRLTKAEQFSIRLRRLLRDEDWQPRDLYESIGIPVARAEAFVSGYQLPTRSEARHIAAFLGVKVEELFSLEMEP
jgi:hypothetical protein